MAFPEVVGTLSLDQVIPKIRHRIRWDNPRRICPKGI
jgi:hypothetical protein